jgi:hypothetical protein
MYSDTSRIAPRRRPDQDVRIRLVAATTNATQWQKRMQRVSNGCDGGCAYIERRGIKPRFRSRGEKQAFLIAAYEIVVLPLHWQRPPGTMV